MIKLIPTRSSSKESELNSRVNVLGCQDKKKKLGNRTVTGVLNHQSLTEILVFETYYFWCRLRIYWFKRLTSVFRGAWARGKARARLIRWCSMTIGNGRGKRSSVTICRRVRANRSLMRPKKTGLTVLEAVAPDLTWETRISLTT